MTCSALSPTPLVPNEIPVHCYVYDVATGRLIEIPEATAAGNVLS